MLKFALILLVVVGVSGGVAAFVANRGDGLPTGHDYNPNPGSGAFIADGGTAYNAHGGRCVEVDYADDEMGRDSESYPSRAICRMPNGELRCYRFFGGDDRLSMSDYSCANGRAVAEHELRRDQP
jgi:hypothetical protein